MIRAFLLAATLVPWVSTLAQESVAAGSAQEIQVPVPTSRIELYAGFRSNGGTDFMLGAEYTHRRPEWQKFGAAAFFEVVFANQTEFLFGAMAKYFVTPRLTLETGPGMAFNHGTDFLWRIGGEYEFRTRRLSITPMGYFDFVHGTTVFGYGVTLGVRR
jgi:hypothetical protein